MDATRKLRTVTIVMSLPGVLALSQDKQRPIDAQTASSDSVLPPNSLTVQFDRNINTFNWIGRAILDTTLLGTRVRLKERYATNIIKTERTGTDRRPLSAQQELSLLLSRPIAENLSLQTRWSSLVHTDDKSVGISSASMNQVLGGVDYYPLPFFSISPMLGYRWENQLDFRDQGLSYNIGARTQRMDFDGYIIDGVAQYQEDRPDPRVLGDQFARVRAEKQFLGKTRDSLEIGVRRNQREFYTQGGSRIESRIENVLSFVNLLDYELLRNVVATVFVNITSRKLDKDVRTIREIPGGPVTFDTGIDEFRMDTFLQTAYASDDDKFTGRVRISHSERDERHFAKPKAPSAPDSVKFLFTKTNEREQTKNNLARRTSISGNFGFPVSLSDRLSFSGTVGILRYDTPSPANLEDRDELLAAVSLSTFHRISQYLEIALELDGSFSHIVYLLKDRSANNNVNRILRLSPKTVYRPFRNLTTRNSFEVLANYTVFDFEQEGSQIRSFSYRQFSWIDSTSLELTSRIGIDAFAYLKLYERGQLNWDQFTERVENSFVDKTYALQIRFSPSSDAVFAVGVRFFSQTRFGFQGGERKLESVLRSIGPTCWVVWGIGPHSQLSLRGWYEHQRQTNGTTRTLANMTLNIHISL